MGGFSLRQDVPGCSKLTFFPFSLFSFLPSLFFHRVRDFRGWRRSLADVEEAENRHAAGRERERERNSVTMVGYAAYYHKCSQASDSERNLWQSVCANLLNFSSIL